MELYENSTELARIYLKCYLVFVIGEKMFPLFYGPLEDIQFAPTMTRMFFQLLHHCKGTDSLTAVELIP